MCQTKAPRRQRKETAGAVPSQTNVRPSTHMVGRTIIPQRRGSQTKSARHPTSRGREEYQSGLLRSYRQRRPAVQCSILFFLIWRPTALSTATGSTGLGGLIGPLNAPETRSGQRGPIRVVREAEAEPQPETQREPKHPRPLRVVRAIPRCRRPRQSDNDTLLGMGSPSGKRRVIPGACASALRGRPRNWASLR